MRIKLSENLRELSSEEWIAQRVEQGAGPSPFGPMASPQHRPLVREPVSTCLPGVGLRIVQTYKSNGKTAKLHYITTAKLDLGNLHRKRGTLLCTSNNERVSYPYGVEDIHHRQNLTPDVLFSSFMCSRCLQLANRLGAGALPPMVELPSPI